MPSGPVAAEHPTGRVTELDGNRDALSVGRENDATDPHGRALRPSKRS